MQNKKPTIEKTLIFFNHTNNKLFLRYGINLQFLIFINDLIHFKK